jgi:outer membrane murein-binding lipoprotein Lpp
MKPQKLLLPLVAALVLVVAGCQSGEKMSAQAAITAAQTAFTPVKALAEKYVPDQTAAVETSINGAQTAYNNGDYAGALTSAKALPGQITDLATAAKAKKDELTQQWTSLSSSLPPLMTSVGAKVSRLAAAHKLPTASKEQFDGAKSLWETATSAFSSGDIPTAVKDGDSVKQTLTSLAEALHVKTA